MYSHCFRALVVLSCLSASSSFAQTTPSPGAAQKPTTMPAPAMTAPAMTAPTMAAPAMTGSTCKGQAADKKLAGAAFNSFMKKCETDAGTLCATQASDKKLAGAAKTSFTKKCVTDAVGT
jgi:hypothetical protein